MKLELVCWVPIAHHLQFFPCFHPVSSLQVVNSLSLQLLQRTYTVPRGTVHRPLK
jgi:hypothetical protein